MVKGHLTLEQRIARLERALSRKNESNDLGHKLLNKFVDELYAEVDLTSYKGNHINTTKTSSGRINSLLEIDNNPDKSTWDDFVAVCKRFESENDCKISARVLHYNIGWFIDVTIKFKELANDDLYSPSRQYRSDDEDSYDYSDPEYQDMMKSAKYAQSQRDMGI